MIPESVKTKTPRCPECQWALAFTWGHSSQHWRAFCSNPKCETVCVMPHLLDRP